MSKLSEAKRAHEPHEFEDFEEYLFNVKSSQAEENKASGKLLLLRYE